MPTQEEIGARITAAIARTGKTRVAISEETGLSRDTIRKIEAGRPGNERKRYTLLDHLGLNADGLPADDPSLPENLGPRLNNIERQIDELWKRIDERGSVDVAITEADGETITPTGGVPSSATRYSGAEQG